jgi:hypothetical protein
VPILNDILDHEVIVLRSGTESNGELKILRRQIKKAVRYCSEPGR